MKDINYNDVYLMLDKTHLDVKKLLSLVEEERDYNLLVNSIASSMSQEEIKSLINNISHGLLVKLAFYNSSKDKNYDIEDKSYVCAIVQTNYKYIYKKGYLLDSNQSEEKLHLLQLFNSDKIDENLLDITSKELCELGKCSIGNNILEWINIINKSKKLISCVNK
jgi:hypothetical protein